MHCSSSIYTVIGLETSKLLPWVLRAFCVYAEAFVTADTEEIMSVTCSLEYKI